MRRGDIVWLFVFLCVIFVLIYPETNIYYKIYNTSHPILIGFIKFFILATMGELLSIRIAKKNWEIPVGIYYRAVIWGFLGMVIVVVFELFSKGVIEAMKSNILPFYGVPFAFAFFTSLIMNLTFAPTMMAFHRITDMYIEIYYRLNKRPQLTEVVSEINWSKFVDFVVLKTIPFFWIPAHTLTFLLPSEYRIIIAALLSIALGGILAFSNKTPKTKNSHT